MYLIPYKPAIILAPTDQFSIKKHSESQLITQNTCVNSLHRYVAV